MNKKDYKLTVKITNNNILDAFEKLGIKFGLKWCEANDISYLQILGYINLTNMPFDKNQELKKSAEKLCVLLKVMANELWTDTQLIPLKNNKVNYFVNYEDIANLRSPEEYYLTDFDKMDREKIVSEALDTVSNREKEVLSLRYYEGLTLDEIGKNFNISKTRVMQIEQKALRKLRHPTRAKNLKVYYNELFA